AAALPLASSARERSRVSPVLALGLLAVVGVLATRLPRLPPRRPRSLDVLFAAGTPLLLLGIVLGPGIELLDTAALRALSPVTALTLGWLGALLGARCERRYVTRIPRRLWLLSGLEAVAVLLVVGLAAWLLARARPALGAAWTPRLPAVLALGTVAAASGPGAVALAARTLGVRRSVARVFGLAATLATAWATLALAAARAGTARGWGAPHLRSVPDHHRGRARPPHRLGARGRPDPVGAADRGEVGSRALRSRPAPAGRDPAPAGPRDHRAGRSRGRPGRELPPRGRRAVGHGTPAPDDHRGGRGPGAARGPAPDAPRAPVDGVDRAGAGPRAYGRIPRGLSRDADLGGRVGGLEPRRAGGRRSGPGGDASRGGAPAGAVRPPAGAARGPGRGRRAPARRDDPHRSGRVGGDLAGAAGPHRQGRRRGRSAAAGSRRPARRRPGGGRGGGAGRRRHAARRAARRR